jgi:hypothetical protein
MNNEIQTLDTSAIASLILKGDLKALSPEQKVQYYNAVCDRVGLDPVARPFAYMNLSGKEVLYCDKGGAEQLRKLHKVSLKITDRQKIEEVYVVTCEATMPDGRCDASTGAVAIAGLKGDSMANALMKAETKSKRRATLSILGLGMLDESELETIPQAARMEIKPPVRVQAPKPVSIEQAPVESAPEAISADPNSDLSGYVIQVGKKYRGQRLGEIEPVELESFLEWLRAKDGESRLSGPMLETMEAISNYLFDLKARG